MSPEEKMVLVGIFHGLMSKDARIAGRFATSKAFSAMLHQRCVRTHVEVVASSREGGMVQGEARGKRQQERQHCRLSCVSTGCWEV